MPGGIVTGIGGVLGFAGGSKEADAAGAAANAQVAGNLEAVRFGREALNYTSGLNLPDVRAGADARARQMLMTGSTPEQVKEYLRSVYAQKAFDPGTMSSPPVGASGPSGLLGLTSEGLFGTNLSIGERLLGDFSPKKWLLDNDKEKQDAARRAQEEYANRPLNTQAPTLAPLDEDSLDWIDSFNPQEFLESTPGFQFRLDEGTKAIDRSAAARGRLFSGGTGRELTRYGQGLGAEYWDKYYDELGALSGTGAIANRQQQQNVNNFASNAGDAAQSSGRARASGYANQALAMNNAYGSLANSFGKIGASQGWFD